MVTSPPPAPSTHPTVATLGAFAIAGKLAKFAFTGARLPLGAILMRGRLAFSHNRTVLIFDTLAHPLKHVASAARGETTRAVASRVFNRRIQALRQFSRWLVRTRRLRFDPLETLARLNEDTDRRLVRRALTPEELGRLLTASASRPVEEAVERARDGKLSDKRRSRLERLGASRRFLYAFAAGTGLRRGELSTLRWCDADLDRGEVTVIAKHAKSRREQRIPLRSDLAAELSAQKERVRAVGESVAATARVFPGRLFPTHRTLAADLKAAGIAQEDAEGRRVDLHALRTTFISSLSAAGVHPRTAQALARHSRLELTMKAYTDLHLLDLRGAVESLVPVNGTVAETLAASRPQTSANGRSSPEADSEDAQGHSVEKPQEKAQRAPVGATMNGGSDGTRTRDLRLDRPRRYEPRGVSATSTAWRKSRNDADLWPRCLVPRSGLDDVGAPPYQQRCWYGPERALDRRRIGIRCRRFAPDWIRVYEYAREGRFAMARTVRALLLICAVLALWFASQTSHAGPPPPWQDLPGEGPLGRVRARWIAPYVQHVETQVADRGVSRVTWYGSDGSVTRDVEGVVASDFVWVAGEGGTECHATLADWTATLPEVPPGTETYLHAAGPRVLVRDRWTDAGRVGAEVYVDGRLASTLGPFLRYRADNFETNEDGSLAVLIRATTSSSTPRIQAFAPGGRPTFEADCNGHALIVAVAPEGKGVLVEANEEDGEHVQGRWSWVTKTGYASTLDLRPNPHIVAWVPGKPRALVACSVGDCPATFRLIDFAEGRVVWQADDPAARAAYRSNEQVAIEEGHVLLAGIECTVVDGIGHWQRSVYALELATGKLEASWRSPFTGPPGFSAPQFMRTAGGLFLVSDENFARFPMADLASLKNGWRSGS